MRRILMVYDRFPPFNVSGSARPFRFVKHLPEFGYLPLVITSEPAPHESENSEILQELPPGVEIMRARPAVRPTLTPLVRALSERKRNRSRRGSSRSVGDFRELGHDPGSGKAPHVARASQRWTTSVSGAVLWSLDWYVDWGWPALRLASRAARTKRFDLVWASAPHSRNAFAGYVISKRLGIPLVLDLRDPWTYGSIWRPRLPWTGRVETWWAGKIMEHAARVVFTSPLTERTMQSLFPRAKVCTITNGFDRSEVEPLRDVHPEKCLLRYTGALNDRRVPDVLLAGLKLAAEDQELAREIHLEFIGGMAGHEHKIAEYGVEGLVSFRGLVPKRVAERLIRGSDVNVLLQTIREGQDVIAGKVFDYLAARKPILAVVSTHGGDAWLLEKYQAGTVVSFDDPRAVARAVRQQWQTWRAGSREASKLDLTQFSSPALTEQLARVFDSVLLAAS